MSRDETGAGLAFAAPREGEGEGRSPSDAPSRLLRRALWAVAAALLLTPLAHGCHGDDVDHEPLLIPFRSNPEDR